MQNWGLIVWLVLNVYWIGADGNVEQMDRFKSKRESSVFTSESPSTLSPDGKVEFDKIIRLGNIWIFSSRI